MEKKYRLNFYDFQDSLGERNRKKPLALLVMKISSSIGRTTGSRTNCQSRTNRVRVSPFFSIPCLCFCFESFGARSELDSDRSAFLAYRDVWIFRFRQESFESSCQLLHIRSELLLILKTLLASFSLLCHKIDEKRKGISALFLKVRSRKRVLLFLVE